ncbi:MAG: hypothetical protein HKN11_18535 [Rhizobiales bacterium]|nr:hypothetical protein [Hyphomicrobiales bacterium]
MSNGHQEKDKQRSSSQLSEVDIAQDKMGDNSLQGNDQANVRNQRHAVPDVKLETDGIIEGLEKLDKDKRAQADLGKGNRYPPDHEYNSESDD